MAKIYPSENRKGESESPPSPPQLAALIMKKTPLQYHLGLIPLPSVLTAWKRSSMNLQGTDGFMVFDNRGKLIFRVDNYTRHSWSAAGGGLLLLDARGKVLFTLKPQFIMGMHQQWKGYRGEEDESKAAFIIRRPRKSRGNTKSEAEVFLGENAFEQHSNSKPDLICEGSFKSRNCKISTVHNDELVAEISKKRVNSTVVLKDDVFSITVQPGFDPAIMMAFVMILDRICHKPFITPIICS